MLIGIVVPLFNEAEIVPDFYRSVRKTIDILPDDFQIMYVDDGSTDGTAEALRSLAESDARVIVCQLSANFGHQGALAAGLDNVAGEAVITMDGDGQHPTELIPELIALYKQGHSVVQTQWLDDRSLPLKKRLPSMAFYRVLNLFSDTEFTARVGDFRMISRAVVEDLGRLGNRRRYIRGAVQSLGYPTATIEYVPKQRLRGASRYSPRKMLDLALVALAEFGQSSLNIVSILGVATFLVLALGAILIASQIPGAANSRESSFESAALIAGVTGSVLVAGLVGYLWYRRSVLDSRPLYNIQSIEPHSAIGSSDG